jgi:signal transduction histidine kinase
MRKIALFASPFQGTVMDEAAVIVAGIGAWAGSTTRARLETAPSELIVYSRRLEEKSQELEAATKELRGANERLKEFDKLKDDFVTTVSHELRTPLTSIRSFSEIVHNHPDLPIEERREFLQIIVQESERLTRLLNDILAKVEAGNR